MTRRVAPIVIIAALGMIIPGVVPAAVAATAKAPADKAPAGFSVDHAVVPEAPPGVQVMAGFMTMVNKGDKPLVVQGGTSPEFGSVEMHETRKVNGMAEMVQVKSLTIPAHGQMVFAPGSNHFMLMRPKAPLKKGDSVHMHLTFAGGQSKTITLPVVDGSSVYHH